MMRKTRDMDMLSGGVFRKVLLFTLPLLFSGLLLDSRRESICRRRMQSCAKPGKRWCGM